MTVSESTTAFLSHVVEFLESEILPEPYDTYRYFDKCVARADDQNEVVKVKRLSFCRKTPDGSVARVNDVLSRSELQIEFHFVDGESVTDSWGDFLNQLVVRLEASETSPPPVLKWESTRDRVGNLKHDEWFGPDEAYVAQDISAREAIRRGVERQLYRIVPELESRSVTSEISGPEVRVLYDDDSRILAGLDAYHKPD